MYTRPDILIYIYTGRTRSHDVTSQLHENPSLQRKTNTTTRIAQKRTPIPSN